MLYVLLRTYTAIQGIRSATRTSGVTLAAGLSLQQRLKNNMNVVRNGLAFAVMSCLSLSAQQITGNIRGTVIDPSGAVIPGAAVTARQAETGLSRMTTTDRNGNYVLLELPVGHYRLQVTAKGFQEYVQDGITLNVNETASVSPHLAVGSEKQQVLVSGDAALIEPTVTSMGKVVQQRELEDLPLNGRNFSQLGLLQPGVVPLTPGYSRSGRWAARRTGLCGQRPATRIEQLSHRRREQLQRR